MKIILVLLDGLGDRSYKILGHRTPLEAASTPNMDRLAYLGSNGFFHASSSGQSLPSEIAHFLLFGYDLKQFPGRGLLEAVGYGIEFDNSDVLCLAHLCGIKWQDDVPVLTKGRDEIKGTPDEIGKLFNAISTYRAEGIRFQLQQTRRNDAILILSGDVSPYVSDSDPMIKGMYMGNIVPLSDTPEPGSSKRTARSLNKYLSFCCRMLSDQDRSPEFKRSQANFLATQRCGRRIPQTPFDQLWGLKGALIASGLIFGGLARELGLDFIKAKDTKHPAKDLKDRIGIALQDSAHQFVHVHTKVPDEAAHKGDPELKKKVISELDQGLDELVKAVESRDDLVVAITGDHSTPSISPMIHSGEPNPLTIVSPRVRRDQVNCFDEIKAASGCLGLLRGRELMQMLLNYADQAVLIGHRMGSTSKAYLHSDYEPFKLV